MPSASEKRDQERPDLLPPRRLPLLYFSVAHGALMVAFATVALDPATFAGFFYHPRMVAVVHLVTLGWISGSILGAIYIVGPMALRLPMRATLFDSMAFVIVVAGAAGMVYLLWMERFDGMAWSAVMVVAGVSAVGVRVGMNLASARIPAAVKAHVALAFANILSAGSAGIFLGFNKNHALLVSGQPLSLVYAHAHLAAIGWAMMMVVGTGYRLLPMILPAGMPSGRTLWISVILLQAGSVGLFLAFFTRSSWLPLCAVLVVGGMVAFIAHVLWMMRHRRPAPVATRRPDFGVLHSLQALIYLILAGTLGLVLSLAPSSTWTLRCAAAYGVLGLIGFLAQMVVGVQARLLPMFSALHAIVRSQNVSAVPAPQAMPHRALQATVFGLWTVGVPALASGMALEVTPLVAAGAWMLLIAATLGAVNAVSVSRHALLTSRVPRVHDLRRSV